MIVLFYEHDIHPGHDYTRHVSDEIQNIKHRLIISATSTKRQNTILSKMYKTSACVLISIKLHQM